MSAHTLEILSVEGIGPDADGDLNIEIKFSVTNKSGLDWDQLTTRTQIVNELGHIEETSDTHEEVIEDGDSKELSINFYGVKGKSFLVAPEISYPYCE
jgi:hypothetical protein